MNWYVTGGTVLSTLLVGKTSRGPISQGRGELQRFVGGSHVNDSQGTGSLFLTGVRHSLPPRSGSDDPDESVTDRHRTSKEGGTRWGTRGRVHLRP